MPISIYYKDKVVRSVEASMTVADAKAVVARACARRAARAALCRPRRRPPRRAPHRAPPPRAPPRSRPPTRPRPPRHAAAEATRLSVHRVELRERVAAGADKAAAKAAARYTDSRKTLASYGLADGGALAVKDLGAQFSYRGVFLIEYAGPIAIMALYAARPAAVFGPGARPLDLSAAFSAPAAAAPGGSPAWTAHVQALAVVMWLAHFAKRELETLFVHKFSRPTMPASNLVKNSAYYWLFALAVGYPLCAPGYTAPADKTRVAAAAAGWLAAQAVNLGVHLQLAGMRPAEGSTDRRAPGGPLFALVSCPNYTAEVLGWVFWSAMCQVGAGYVFTAVGFAQMLQWALDKHRGYAKADPAYKKLGRKAIVPFII